MKASVIKTPLLFEQQWSGFTNNSQTKTLKDDVYIS